jgi:hypothetical protein
MTPVIPLDLARRLKAAGLAWKPATGDHFAIPDRDLDDQVFVLSNMTIEVQEMPDGPVIGFNGTTEWALDDVAKDEAIWLPREGQLRTLLGGTFRALVREGDHYRVEIQILDEWLTLSADSPEEGYALALLRLLDAAGVAEPAVS